MSGLVLFRHPGQVDETDMAMVITYNQQYAFVAFTTHGLVDGASIQVRNVVFTISGDPIPEFNGYFVVHYIDEDHFAYFVGDVVIPPLETISGGELRHFTQSYFTGIFYAGIGNYDIVQDEVSGDLLFMLPDNYTDAYAS